MDVTGIKIVQFSYFVTVCRIIDNLVSRVTRLLDECGSIPVRGKNLQYRNAWVLVLEHVRPSVQWVPTFLFPVVKLSGRDTDKALNCSVDVKNK